MRLLELNDTSDCSGKVVQTVTDGIHEDDDSFLIVLGVINFTLAVVTSVANALVIVAILTTSSLRTPSYLLLTSLAFSDLAVGLIFQPLYGVLSLSLMSKNIKLFCFFQQMLYAGASITCCASLMSMTAISVDRCMAIRLKINYKTVVTLPRIRRILVAIWILSSAAMCTPFLFDLFVLGVTGAAGILGFLLVILYCYIECFRRLKAHFSGVQPKKPENENSISDFTAVDLLKYKKLLKTLFLVVILTYAFYLPLVGVCVCMLSRDPKTVVMASLLSAVTLNSTFNPMIYMTRMREVRQACVRVTRRVYRLVIRKTREITEPC